MLTVLKIILSLGIEKTYRCHENGIEVQICKDLSGHLTGQEAQYIKVRQGSQLFLNGREVGSWK